MEVKYDFVSPLPLVGCSSSKVMTSTNLFAVALGCLNLGAMYGAFTASPAKRWSLVLSAKTLSEFEGASLFQCCSILKTIHQSSALGAKEFSSYRDCSKDEEVIA